MVIKPTMNDIASFVLLCAVLALGLWCLIAPGKVVAFRRRRGFPDRPWSGGWFYATEQSTRAMGGVLVALALTFLFFFLLSFLVE